MISSAPVGQYKSQFPFFDVRDQRYDGWGLPIEYQGSLHGETLGLGGSTTPSWTVSTATDGGLTMDRHHAWVFFIIEEANTNSGTVDYPTNFKIDGKDFDINGGRFFNRRGFNDINMFTGMVRPSTTSNSFTVSYTASRGLLNTSLILIQFSNVPWDSGGSLWSCEYVDQDDVASGSADSANFTGLVDARPNGMVIGAIARDGTSGTAAFQQYFSTNTQTFSGSLATCYTGIAWRPTTTSTPWSGGSGTTPQIDLQASSTDITACAFSF